MHWAYVSSAKNYPWYFMLLLERNSTAHWVWKTFKQRCNISWNNVVEFYAVSQNDAFRVFLVFDSRQCLLTPFKKAVWKFSKWAPIGIFLLSNYRSSSMRKVFAVPAVSVEHFSILQFTLHFYGPLNFIQSRSSYRCLISNGRRQLLQIKNVLLRKS